MQSSPVPGAGMPGHPPPPDQVRDRLRRRLLAVGAFTGPGHWLLVRGTVLATAFLALYLATGFTIGWRTAYDVTIGITSPGDGSKVREPVLAWFMSVAGWLAVPAVCGAVAGVFISVAINDRRQRPISEALTKVGPPR